MTCLAPRPHDAPSSKESRRRRIHPWTPNSLPRIHANNGGDATSYKTVHSSDPGMLFAHVSQQNLNPDEHSHDRTQTDIAAGADRGEERENAAREQDHSQDLVTVKARRSKRAGAGEEELDADADEQ
jgi:hypothetical protein